MIKDISASIATRHKPPALLMAQSHYKEVAMVVPSSSSKNDYGWLGQFPRMKEWLGDRVIKNLTAHSYSIVNKLYEDTISVKRTEIEDDQYGIFSPLFEEMGRVAHEHPDELVFNLLKNGFNTFGYDGQNFFDTDHPVKDEDGNEISVSNMQAGAETPWYMLDCSRAIKPLIFQERFPPKFSALDREGDQNVFMQDEYIYGLRARSNAGFGLWQLAYGSKDVLSYANFTAVRAAMREMKGDESRPLGIRPTHLVVPPSLEEAGRAVLENETRIVESAGGDIAAVSNPWRGSMKLVVSEWLS